ncbi:uncharacterized protein LOC124939147 [Impatiens glandulifera]|uniref:uncharacterized protein LOC124939147 n=1 Tax=Impatiens glandulifera TaxID=253017 RepID=UPI001FB182FF|nr:uncharacterized protein LOC124939147 [Impatiens glandulifera]
MVDSPVKGRNISEKSSTGQVPKKTPLTGHDQNPPHKEPKQHANIPDPVVLVSQQEVEEMFKQILQQLEEEGEEISRPYYHWCKIRSEVKFMHMLPDYTKNKHWSTLMAMEDEVFNMAKSDFVPLVLARGKLVNEHAILQVLTKALEESRGEPTEVEKKVVEKVIKLRDDLKRDIARLEEESKERLVFEHGESSKPTGDQQEGNRPKSSEDKDGHHATPSGKSTSKSHIHVHFVESNPANQEEPKMAMLVHSLHPEQSHEVAHLSADIRELIFEVVQGSMDKYQAAAEARTATINSNLIETIRTDAETTLKLQHDEEEQERLKKEREEDDFCVAQQFQEEEKAKQKEDETVQVERPRGMITRARSNKRKRRKITELLSRVEQGGPQLVENSIAPFDEEEEEDDIPLNPRNRKLYRHHLILQPVRDHQPNLHLDRPDQKAVSSTLTVSLPPDQVS